MIVLTVIVVTWNSAATIEACLDAVPARVAGGEVETIIVDNNSSDGTPDIVTERFPTAKLVRNAENLGFARANNLAIGLAHAGTVLLLNPDTILCEPDAVPRMLAVLAGDLSIAAIGCRLIFPDGRHQVGDAGFRPTKLNMIAHGLGLAHVLPGLKSLYLVRPDRFKVALCDVDWVCGACLMVRRDAAVDCGGLDETMFLYAEDIAFGCAVRDAGHRVAYLPGVRVVHVQGASEAQVGGSAVSTRWLETLLALHARLHAGRWQRAVCLAFAAGFAMRAAVYATASPVRAKYRPRAAALWRYACVAFRSRRRVYPDG